MLKKYLMFGGLIGGVLISSQAKASYGNLSWEPRVGLEYQYSTMGLESSWATFLPKKLNHVGVSFGAKVHEFLGFDLSYMYSAEKKRLSSLTAGGTFLGGTVVTSSNYTNKVKFNYVGFDINGYISFNDNLSLVISPGVAIGKPRYTLSAQTAGTTLGPTLANIQGKMRPLPRISVGFEYIELDVGVKLMYRWLGASKARIKIDTATFTDSAAEKPFKDSSALALNIFIRV